MELKIHCHHRYEPTTLFSIVFARLIEYPSNKVVGYSSFTWGKGVSFFGSANSTMDKMLDNMSWAIVDKLVKKTDRKK